MNGAYEMGFSTGGGEDPSTPNVDREWLSSPVRRSMNRMAPVYLDHRWLQGRATRWDYRVTRQTLLEELAPGPDDKILEFGCGPGTWTVEIASRCKEMVALDISENMIKEASRQVRGLPVQFMHSDFLAAQPEGRFDKIFSVRVIEYIFDRNALGQKISELLVPGEIAVLITKTRFSIWRGRRRLMGLVFRPWAFPPGTNPLGDDSGERRHPPVRQSLPSPGQLVQAFRPFGLFPRKVRPIVVRAPIYQKGFDELPIIPDAVASPFLGISSLLYRIGSRLPHRVASPLFFMSESYCITFQSVVPNKLDRAESSGA